MAEAKTDLLIKEICGFRVGSNDGFYVYYQPNKRDVPDEINKMLTAAGGKPVKESLEEYITDGKKSFARPEYIITFDSTDDLIVVIEAKSNIKNHESKDLDRPRKCAVDGVLYYAKYLKERYNVICVAVSGEEKDDLNVSTFVWHKGSTYPENKSIISLLPINSYKEVYENRYKIPYNPVPIRKLAQDLHDYLRELGYSEKEKPLFIAGILIALMNSSFREAYGSFNKSNDFIKFLNQSIKGYLEELEGVKTSKVNYMSSVFSGIFTNTKLKNMDINDNLSIKSLTRLIHKNIYPMMNMSTGHDVIGEFYNEFIRYSGGDGKGLGIVLTPPHITDLFCEIAEVNKNSKVLDICCGTGSFLVSALHKMFEDAKNTAVSRDALEEEIENIKSDGVYGIEINQELHTLAYANMIVRQDGKSNINNEDCFSRKMAKELKNKCNIGLINPPYSQKTPEIKFIERMLDLLCEGGIGVAIVPMSVAIGTKFKNERKAIMKKHRLLAVMSMPDDLFYPVGVNTCIMVWKAHEPHDKDKYKTWFGFWKDDGFVKNKKQGRVDYHRNWQDIKKEWLYMYRNKEVIDGKSAYEAVDENDEWLAEAYMKTDYSKLTKKDFDQTLRDYLAYLIKSGDFND